MSSSDNMMPNKCTETIQDGPKINFNLIHNLGKNRAYAQARLKVIKVQISQNQSMKC